MAGPRHELAKNWLEDQLWGSTSVAMPWPSLLAFLRLVTNPRIYARPQTLERAWKQVNDWLSCEPVWIPSPTQEHVTLLERMLAAVPAGHNWVPDAHLAALAVEHGLKLCTLDRGFARFPTLRWFNPLD